MTETTKEDSPATEQPADSDPQRQGVQVEVTDTHAVCDYANFCRVTGAFEELIIDFGMSSQPAGAVPTTINIDQRIVLNYYTAKRLLHALSMSIQRHESVFGVLETDVQKRVKTPPMGDAK